MVSWFATVHPPQAGRPDQKLISEGWRDAPRDHGLIAPAIPAIAWWWQYDPWLHRDCHCSALHTCMKTKD